MGAGLEAEANVRVPVMTLYKPDKQPEDPTAQPKEMRPIGTGEPLQKIAQSPMPVARPSDFNKDPGDECALIIRYYAPMLLVACEAA